MSRTLGLYAFEPGAPGVPISSATGVFINGLVGLLEGTEGLEVRTRWLRPVEAGPRPRAAEWLAGAGWMARELGRLLGDDSRYLLLIYPKVPVLAHVDEPAMLGPARQAYRALRARHAITRQRLVIIVEDLPIEMARGRERAGGPPARIAERAVRGIERTVLRGAHRLIVPNGFVETIRELHGIAPERFRTFRRNIYMPGTEADEDPPLDFESGAVNFFYSGGVDGHVAANFREMLRSIRNAPQTRLHVCGPGRDSVREWLDELDVPNVRHHGQLGVAAHDWLARRCDVGLILYPTDNPYNHLTPTMKYSAYLANGLAVLSTDLRSVAENVRSDGVGQAMPIKELAMELLRWATRPKLWREAKENAEAQAAIVRSGVEMRPWIEEIARGE